MPVFYAGAKPHAYMQHDRPTDKRHGRANNDQSILLITGVSLGDEF